MAQDAKIRTASISWALILAGGSGRRMTGDGSGKDTSETTDKAFLELGGMPLVARLLKRLRPQSNTTIISANGDPARFAALACPIVADAITETASAKQGKHGLFLGPLAGIHAGLMKASTARERPHWVVSVPVDTPFAPEDLVRRLIEEAERKASPLAIATSGGQIHWAAAAWHVDLAARLGDWLKSGNKRKIEAFARSVSRSSGPALAEWPVKPKDPFFNINTPKDLESAEALL